jgi:transposase InsO family protein
MDYFTKWPKAYANLDQEASTVADVLVTNFSFRFGIPRELHSDQGRNFESRLLQEILQRLGVGKTPTTPLHPQSDGIVERYIKTVEEHLRKVVASNQKDWNAMLPLFYWPIWHPRTIPLASPQQACYSEESSDCPAICCSGHPPTRSGQQPSMRQTW